jgi:FkbM family methyltransferase
MQPLIPAGKRLLTRLGLKASRLQPPGSALRPTADLVSVLEDCRARGFDPGLVFDAGASDGAWMTLVAPVFPRARGVLLEPRPSVYAGLARWAAARPSQYVPVNSAVGAVAGTGALTNWATGSTLLASAGAATTAVSVTTLDDLAREHGIPDLVKLDIEGFELEALRGAASLFGKTEMFLLETALFSFGMDRPTLPDIVAFMRERGYAVYDVAGFIRRPFDGALGLIDLCFVRDDGLLRSDSRSWQADRRPPLA